MKNEDKAKEIELDVYVFGDKPKGQFEAPAYRAALEMAEWKDQQFKEYLEKKYKDASNSYDKTEAEFYEDRMDYINEIINELFGE